MKLQQIEDRVAQARREALREAKNSGEACVFSRGTWLCTSDKNGQCRPAIEAECPDWDGTLRSINALIALVTEGPEAERFKGVEEVYIAGGYDSAESPTARNAGDYNPWASAWCVPIWRRDSGWVEDRCSHGMFKSGAGACPQCGGGAA